MDMIWQFLVTTPWWVYVLLVYLIRIGIKESKMRRVKLRNIFIIPLVFLLMSLHTLFTTFGIDTVVVFTWLFATVFGTILGWLQIFRYILRIDKKHNLIQIQGTWSTLVILLIMFVANYYFSYELVINSLLVRQPFFENSVLIISGISIGFFIEKLLCYLYRFKTLKHSNLVS